ncbi:GDP-mannose 4,6-dehydratase [Nocardioides sp. HDW12B]|uniref:GDP-mannose 4,6-dehydratase n=1 Tax=Nocardioides sp. HDW12B TaxID=2714939 RepID=UPI0014092944|nr:GDP-mannose 4,6-dehydratase [Nocardioides sp. HDW12B]QIK68252.1 GDP-mannose 4,6-dehydratase [Nocardioides sp. HDW12B]
MKTALITGITGQDGSYLAELLLAKGYAVHGLVRRSSSANIGRLQAMVERGRVDAPDDAATVGDPALHLHYGDVNDGTVISRLVQEVAPDEVYNLAAMSQVPLSFEIPEYTASTNGGGTVRLLEAIRAARLDCRFYQASTSEMFGLTPPPQNEDTAFRPRSPYGTSKLFAHWSTVNYRETFGLYAVSGITFNHESPRRGENFVTRKISRGVAAISRGEQDELVLGNLDAVRDWGYAPEYVEGMWLMLQQDEPTDFVLATGTGTTVREFTEAAFSHVGLDWNQHVSIDARFTRPPEAHSLIGDASEAHRTLGWKAQTHARDLARIMVDAELAAP